MNLIEYDQDELRTLHETLGAEDAMKVKLLAQAVAHFDRAGDKRQAVREISEALSPYGITGVTVPSMYRKAQRWRESGVMAIIDRRLLRGRSARGIEANREFVEYWQGLMLSNRRKVAPAYRELLNRLAAGERIPGYGTWRDIYAQEHAGMRPDQAMACPYRWGALVPEGWTDRNLRRLSPGVFALAVAHRGMMAAQMTAIPDVIRTRVGLAPCQAVQIDDMWYEHKVAFAGNRHAERVVEFSMIDVLTGHVIGYLTKPVREREDGTRETLRSEWTRYLIAYLLCEVGITDAGCLVMGEHGTAAADNELLETLSQVSGGKIRFGAGGMLSTPLAKGLYDGRPKGNPRFKGLLEGFHSLIKNELASVKGHMGGGRENEHEEVYGMAKLDERLRGIAGALENVRPGILDRLQLPYMPYFDFLEVIRQMYDRLEARTVHALEGWEECGFVTGEYQIQERGAWLPIESLKEMSPAKAGAFRSLIQAGEIAYRTRRMSPIEAWESRRGELRKMDPIVAVLVMGPKLARVCRCDDKLQLRYKDDTTLSDCRIAGVLEGGGTLTRGKTYLVHINPLAPFRAYVSDAQGRFIGVAPVQAAARYDDTKALERQLGIRQAAIAAERKRLEPLARKRLREENAAAAANVREIFGADPAYDAAIRDAAAMELSGVRAGAIDDADLMPDAVQDAADDGISDDDLLGQ